MLFHAIACQLRSSVLCNSMAPHVYQHPRSAMSSPQMASLSQIVFVRHSLGDSTLFFVFLCTCHCVHFYSTLFHVPPYSIIFHGYHYALPWHCKICRAIPGPSKMCRDIPYYSMVFDATPLYSRLFHNILRYSILFHAVPAISCYSMIF